MMSPELRQAKAALLARKRDIKAELRRLDEAIESLDRVMGASQPSKTGKRGSVKEAVLGVLEDNGGVMHADEILEAVKRRDVEMSSRDPKATVVTALIRLRDAGNVEAHGMNRWEWKRKEDMLAELKASLARSRRSREG